MTINPQKYGLTPELTAENLIKAREVFSALVETVKASSESTQSAEKAIREKYQGWDGGEEFKDIRHTVWQVLQSQPELSVSLFDLLGELKSDVKTFRDAFTHEEVRQGRVKVEVPADFQERKDEAEALSTFIRSMYSAMSSMGIDTGEFPTKKSEKTGEVMPDLPRIPSGPRDSESSGGRGAKVRMLRFAIQDDETYDEVPSGTTLRQVLIQCSDANHVFSPAWLDEELKRTDQNLFSEGWSIHLPNGKTLHGSMPAEK